MKLPSDYVPPSDLLNDRIILVTGAGDGIGRAVSLAAARHGATVVLLGKTVHKLEQVYDEIEAMKAPQAAIYPLHFEGATPADFEQLANTLQENFGRLDGLVHNAALLPYLSRIKDYEPEDWIKVMQVNLNGPMLLTQACYDLLAASPHSSVIFTTDSVAEQAKPFWGAYGASKAALENMARMFARETADTNIHVNLLDPGPTLTALRKRVFPGENNSSLKTPESVAPIYLWLLGGEGALKHGEHFHYG